MKTLIKTFDGEIYIVDGKTPEQVILSMGNLDYVGMPNGSFIHRKAISAFMTYEDYAFQTEQKQRHKKGQFLKGGNWNDQHGVVSTADLLRITGEKLNMLPKK